MWNRCTRCLLEGPHSEMALNCHSLFLHSRWKLIYLWMKTSAGKLMCFKICIVTSHWAGPASAFLSTDAELSCNAGIGTASGAPRAHWRAMGQEMGRRWTRDGQGMDRGLTGALRVCLPSEPGWADTLLLTETPLPLIFHDPEGCFTCRVTPAVFKGNWSK